MDVIGSKITEQYAIYNGDCMDVMKDLPDSKIDLSIYSPPFGGMYHYSSDERDLSNSKNYAEFFVHYEYIVKEIARLTKPGRFSCVHCMDVPRDGANTAGYFDFPGDIIRLHERMGFTYWGRHCVWKEPLAVRNRTMSKGLAHKTIVDDSSLCDLAIADFLLLFRKKGENATTVSHPTGLHEYAGEKQMPSDILKFKGWTGNQIQNRYSHWIWRNYASAFWDDIRVERVLPFKPARADDDEKHVHPLQLDVIERAITLRSNPGEIILTPFMGVGSECFGAVTLGRKAIGIELKESYYLQAVKNMEKASEAVPVEKGLFDETE